MKNQEKASISIMKVICVSIILILISGIGVMAVNTNLKDVNIILKNGYELTALTSKSTVSEILDENNIKFDKYYWKVEDKLQVCQNENIDIMIDDDWRIIKKLSDNKIKTLYFRDTNLMKLKENNYIKEVNNWGEIYRHIKCMKKFL